jgi:hypothetical protein
VLLAASTAGAIFVGVVALSVAIFGSCPTVYTSNGADQRLEAECFSYSIGSKYELPDLDRLEQRTPSSGRFTLRLKNEALETHYIDRFRLGYVDHPAGTEAFPTDDGDVLLARNLVPALTARNSEGTDLSRLLRTRDNVAYRLDSLTAGRMLARKKKDYIDVTLNVPHNATGVTLALRGRNSLENTILLYDVMMRDQGLEVANWSEKLNDSYLYAWRLYQWYSGVSGLDISVEHDGEFVPAGRISDTGPIAWKPVAAHIPLGDHGDTVRIRLSFLPDSWNIDWLGFDATEEEQPELHYISSSSIQDNAGMARADAIRAINDDDGDYLVTYPGEWMDLSFDLPPGAGMQRTLFLDSKGYYVEWVRPEWVRERSQVAGFDISEPEAIRNRLAQIWVARKPAFENQFFQYRIPTADPEKVW